MWPFRPDPIQVQILEELRLIRAELEAHICPATTAQTQALTRLSGLVEGTWSELNRVDTKAAAVLGIKERAELTLLEHIPEWPRTQAEIPDLEAKREELALLCSPRAAEDPPQSPRITEGGSPPATGAATDP